MLKLFFILFNKHSRILFVLISLTLLEKNILLSEENDYLLTGPLAGSIYYTAKKPGRWAAIVDSHNPIISRKGNRLEVITNHEMRGFEHYITKHIVFDKEFKIISEVLFDPSKSMASSSHIISGYSGKIFVMSVCNLHDNWLHYISVKRKSQ